MATKKNTTKKNITENTTPEIKKEETTMATENTQNTNTAPETKEVKAPKETAVERLEKELAAYPEYTIRHRKYFYIGLDGKDICHLEAKKTGLLLFPHSFMKSGREDWEFHPDWDSKYCMRCDSMKEAVEIICSAMEAATLAKKVADEKKAKEKVAAEAKKAEDKKAKAEAKEAEKKAE